MFIWLFHRISGIILIVLVGIKILSGYSLTGEIDWAGIDDFHTSRIVDVSILFLFIYHALYGIRTVLIDLGIKKVRLLFWLFTLSALLLFCLSVYFIYLRPAG